MQTSPETTPRNEIGVWYGGATIDAFRRFANNANKAVGSAVESAKSAVMKSTKVDREKFVKAMMMRGTDGPNKLVSDITDRQRSGMYDFDDVTLATDIKMMLKIATDTAAFDKNDVERVLEALLVNREPTEAKVAMMTILGETGEGGAKGTQLKVVKMLAEKVGGSLSDDEIMQVVPFLQTVAGNEGSGGMFRQVLRLITADSAADANATSGVPAQS